MKRRTKILAIGLLLLAAVIWATGVWHVERDKDRIAVSTILGEEWEGMTLSDSSYDVQLEHIRILQEKSHLSMRKSPPMPEGIHRSASAVLEHGGGWCYDYSSWYESALRIAGMKTRHVALYQKQGGLIKTMLTPNVLSHAGTEVLTARGWMFIEPSINFLWIDAQRKPLRVSDISKSEQDGNLELDSFVLKELYPLYANDFYFIYGFYSRHGRFYKPFLPVPDINWREFLYNL